MADLAQALAVAQALAPVPLLSVQRVYARSGGVACKVWDGRVRQDEVMQRA